MKFTDVETGEEIHFNPDGPAPCARCGSRPHFLVFIGGGTNITCDNGCFKTDAASAGQAVTEWNDEQERLAVLATKWASES